MTMREVEILKNEVVYRLKKQGFVDEEFERMKDNTQYMRIHMALAATFFNSFVCCQVP
jgi:hypothetical protein